MVRNLKELGSFMQRIVKRLMNNQNLLKLLYYTDKDPLSQSDISDDTIRKEIYEKLIKVIPRVGPKETASSLIAIKIDRGKANKNDEFRDIHFMVDVFVPLTQWIIKDENLRPFAIMGEIQKSLQGAKVDGIGQIIGGDFELNFLTEEISCYTITFAVTSYA